MAIAWDLLNDVDYPGQKYRRYAGSELAGQCVAISVASSTQREIVLKALAEVQARELEVHTADAYKKAIDGGVDNPSQFVGQLVTEDFGSEIVKIRERYYRFKDSLFVAYVNARPSIFQVYNANE